MYTRQNHHSITTKQTTVSSVIIVQRIIRQSSGCRQFWQCRKFVLGSGTWGDHNGVINMTLLCNQWSESHNGLSLGAAEVMTHDNGTQCGCGHAETSQHWEVRSRHQVQPGLRYITNTALSIQGWLHILNLFLKQSFSFVISFPLDSRNVETQLSFNSYTHSQFLNWDNNFL